MALSALHWLFGILTKAAISLIVRYAIYCYSPTTRLTANYHAASIACACTSEKEIYSWAHSRLMGMSHAWKLGGKVGFMTVVEGSFITLLSTVLARKVQYMILLSSLLIKLLQFPPLLFWSPILPSIFRLGMSLSRHDGDRRRRRSSQSLKSGKDVFLDSI